MIKRMLTAIVILFVIFFSVFYLRQFSLIFADAIIMFFLVVGSYEMYKSLKQGKLKKANCTIENGEVVVKRENIKPIAPAIICANLLVYPMTYLLSSLGLISALCISTILAVAIFTLKHDNYEIKDLASTILILVYPITIMGMLIDLNHSSMGILSIFSIFAVVVMTDTMAYFVGITCKGPKLCPKISPKKTISGAVGGILGGIIGMVISYLIISHFGLLQNLFPEELHSISSNIGINLGIMLPLGAICSVVAELGDLGASMIKRKVGIKDFGNIFPGHGGVMDRIDSFLFVVPIMYVVFKIIYVVLGV